MLWKSVQTPLFFSWFTKIQPPIETPPQSHIYPLSKFYRSSHEEKLLEKIEPKRREKKARMQRRTITLKNWTKNHKLLNDWICVGERWFYRTFFRSWFLSHHSYKLQNKHSNLILFCIKTQHKLLSILWPFKHHKENGMENSPDFIFVYILLPFML